MDTTITEDFRTLIKLWQAKASFADLLGAEIAADILRDCAEALEEVLKPREAKQCD